MRKYEFRKEEKEKQRKTRKFTGGKEKIRRENEA